jgi:hypothetical protein
MKRKILFIGLYTLLCTLNQAQNPGDLVITEYMANPQDVPNDQGEYIEVFNPTSYPVSLYGCVLQDASDLSVTVDQGIWLNPGDFAVLGRSNTPGATFYFPSSPPPFNLNNIGGDQISITCNGVLVAHTTYSENQVAGVAKSLAGTHLHTNGHTLEAHYSAESYQFQYIGSNSTDYGSPTFAGNTFVLPVTLTRFTATTVNEGILLEWTTSTEINNSHFTLEHSTDGYTYHPVGRIEGAGNSSTSLSYEYLHYLPKPGEHYYRLAQFDFDGTYDYSEVRSATYHLSAPSLYPTAADEEIVIVWPEQIHEESRLAVINLKGQKMTEAIIPAGSRQYTLCLDGVPSGYYCIQSPDGMLGSNMRFIKK